MITALGIATVVLLIIIAYLLLSIKGTLEGFYERVWNHLYYGKQKSPSVLDALDKVIKDKEAKG
ncbi:MAG: hypothetical protein WC734_05560 [Patescibacteria group bacterium]|jgi:hypothetical protein